MAGLAVGLAQLAAGALPPDEARQRARAAAAEALAAGADLVVLPELAVPGYTVDRATLAGTAEGVDGPTVAGWAELVAGTDRVVVGGFCEDDGGVLRNAVAVVTRDGVVGHYRKLHLFGGERDVFGPGDLGLPVVDTPVGRVGVCVCYDLRFVEVLRALSLRGAEVVAVPTAWVPGFDTQRWDAEGWAPQARSAQVQANLDQVVVACASVGGEADGTTFLGSSVLLGPRGEALAGPLGSAGADLAVAEVDLSEVAAAGDRGGHARPRDDRRTDVYSLSVEGEPL